MLNNTSSTGKLTALALALALTAVVQGGVWQCFADNAERVAQGGSAAQPAVTITAQGQQALPATPRRT